MIIICPLQNVEKWNSEKLFFQSVFKIYLSALAISTFGHGLSIVKDDSICNMNVMCVYEPEPSTICGYDSNTKTTRTFPNICAMGFFNCGKSSKKTTFPRGKRKWSQRSRQNDYIIYFFLDYTKLHDGKCTCLNW